MKCPVLPPERVRIVEAGGNGWLVEIWPWSKGPGHWDAIVWNSTREGALESYEVLTGKRRSFHGDQGVGE